MRNPVAAGLIIGLTLASACTARDSAPADTAAAVPGADPADPDRNVAGGGVPAGYTAHTDRTDAPISGASYTQAAGAWEVKTGPAHIVYAPGDTASGSYTVSSTIEQLEAPTHPEAYGIFFGGRDLDQPTRTYAYFLIRGTGELAVKVREGDQTRDVLRWTAGADVPKANAAGRAQYAIAVAVANDAVRFSVNGKQVASVSRAGLPTDGVAGLRINHNLHVRVTPVAIQRQ